MTRHDIEHLAQVLVSIRPLVGEGKIPEDEAERLIDRMLWAIHASKGNPKFDEGAFRNFVLGKLEGDVRQIFPDRFGRKP